MPRTPFGTQHHLETIATPVLAAAAGAAHVAKLIRRARQAPPPARGAVLRPGPATPLWNKLAADAAKTLRKRGEKVKLARILGVSRQRLHLLLMAKTACPDAERTLLLLHWLDARKRGIDLA